MPRAISKGQRPEASLRNFKREARVSCAVLFLFIAVLTPTGSVKADPLDYGTFATLGFHAVVNQIDGRMGFALENGGNGTLNDLNNDLGLPSESHALGLVVAIRPLEHHVVRLYGDLPDLRKGGKVLSRTLQTRNITYPAGTKILSELRTGMFGFGYDLDFLVRPTWYAGMNGDIRYLDLRVRMGNADSGYEDTLSVDELVPCVGAHFESSFPVLGQGDPWMNLGGFARMTFSMTPNYLNYVDLAAGFSVGFRFAGLLSMETKAGYRHESFFHNQETAAGRSMELKRDGLLISVEGLF